MKEVWFIRHGLSESNAGLPTDDPGLIALTPEGHEQARNLANSIEMAPELVICSPYLRTQQTARPLLEKFPQVKTAVWPIHEFDFLSPETCVGTTVAQRKPWVKSYWDACQPDQVHGEGAESFNGFRNRVTACIKRLEETDETLIFVFSHGHVIRAIWQLLQADQQSDPNAMIVFRDRMSLLPVPNTCIFKATYEDNSWKILDPVFGLDV
jgi:broad specificity phosphatase PhoE